MPPKTDDAGLDMTQGRPVTITTPDGKIAITLEQWVDTVIAEALRRHQASCPVGTYKERQIEMDNRLRIAELKLRIVQCLVYPIYLGITAWLVSRFVGG